MHAQITNSLTLARRTQNPKGCPNLKIHPATKELFPIISKTNMAQLEALWTKLQNCRTKVFNTPICWNQL